MPTPIVFFDIAGPDPAAQSRFYTAVFDWEVAGDGRVSAPISGSTMSGLLRTDPAGNRMGLVEMDGDSAKIP